MMVGNKITLVVDLYSGQIKLFPRVNRLSTVLTIMILAQISCDHHIA